MRRPLPSLIALSMLVCAPQVYGQTAVSQPLRWAPDIARFEAADRKLPPMAGSVVFVGSSSIAMWENLQLDFPMVPVLNRGIGGSLLADNVQSAERIVIPYKPHLVILYSGENDLVEGQSPSSILHEFQTFTSIVHKKLPTTRVVFISIKPSIARWTLKDKIRETNRLIKEYVHTDKRLAYVDVFTPMLDTSGHPRHDLFLEDGLHMNANGYAIWRELLEPIVR
jgi:lysophospholipase L1-like esterase